MVRGQAWWLSPPADRAKINVDVAMSSSGDGGTPGAICRDDQGNYLGALAVFFSGITDPATLESLACREALALAGDLALTRFVVASDTRRWWLILQERNTGKICYGHIKNKSKMSKFSVLQFHPWRESFEFQSSQLS
jgi:hypothetical protein